MTRRERSPDLAGLCPGCRRPLAYGQEIVAALVDGRVREYHRTCVPDSVTAGPASVTADDAGPMTVGSRLAAILNRDGDQETDDSPRASDSAPGTAQEGARK